MNTSRTRLVALAAGTLVVTGTALAPQASAEEPWTLNYSVEATTTVAKLKSTNSTTGSATTTLIPSTGAASTDLSLQPFDVPVKVFGFRIATATIQQEPVGKSNGTINFGTKEISQTSQSNLRILRLSPFGPKGINLVGANCKTEKPAEIKVSGTVVGLFDPTNLSGTFTIPKFKGCGLLSGIISSQVSGPDNQINLKLTPR